MTIPCHDIAHSGPGLKTAAVAFVIILDENTGYSYEAFPVCVDHLPHHLSGTEYAKPITFVAIP
jgi:hypothetical protein